MALRRLISRPPRPVVTACAITILALLLPACEGLAPHPRSGPADPDLRLDLLLREHELAAGAGVVRAHEQVVVDVGRIHNEIDRLTLEFPNHVPTLMAAAQLAFEGGEMVKAREYLDRVAGIDPTRADASVLLARIALQQGSIAGARRLLVAQLDRTPQVAELHEVLACVHFVSGEFERASAELSLAAALGGDPARIACNRGLIAERRGDAVTARSEYERALAADPGISLAAGRLQAIAAMRGAP